MHTVFNNQTDGWKLWLCKGSNGDRCDWLLSAGAATEADLGPYNSFVLTP
ncbi:hypothetical protein AB0F11_03045 [Streptomyces sp. NPDC032472]